MGVLLLAEHDNREIKAATRHALTGCLALGGGPVTLLVAGHDCAAAAEAGARLSGVDRVLQADGAAHAEGLAESLAALLARLAKGFSHIAAPAGTFGRNVLPRAAALLDCAMVSDVVGIQDAETFVRPIYAGNALATVRAGDPVKVLSLRPTAFEAATDGDAAAPIETVEPGPAAARTAFVERSLTESERPELSAARIVVAGGRGLQSRDNFHLIEQLADRLGAAVGASRAAVDSGFVPNDYQVGQTGKVVAPDLYIAVGISGAIQHLAGMKDSKVIAAINKDEEAPIFQVADYGLVADLFDALPALMKELEKAGKA